MNLLEKLEKANSGKIQNKVIELPVDDTIENVILTAPDIMAIQRAQNRAFKIELAKLKQEKPESFSLPFDEEEHKKMVDSIKKKRSKKKNNDDFKIENPKSLGHQIANSESMMTAITDLAPKLLKDKQGNILFKTITEQARFRAVMETNIDILKPIIDAYVDLVGQVFDNEAEVKN